MPVQNSFRFSVHLYFSCSQHLLQNTNLQIIAKHHATTLFEYNLIVDLSRTITRQLWGGSMKIQQKIKHIRCTVCTLSSKISAVIYNWNNFASFCDHKSWSLCHLKIHCQKVVHNNAYIW